MITNLLGAYVSMCNTLHGRVVHIDRRDAYIVLADGSVRGWDISGLTVNPQIWESVLYLDADASAPCPVRRTVEEYRVRPDGQLEFFMAEVRSPGAQRALHPDRWALRSEFELTP